MGDHDVPVHGGMPLFVETPQDDGFTLDPVAYERMGAVFREVKEKKNSFGCEPVLQVGLYFSARTRDWYGRENPQRYFRSFVEAHRILVESHIPVGFLFDENVTLERVKQFPLIFLPNIAVLSTSEQDLLRTYVSQGACSQLSIPAGAISMARSAKTSHSPIYLEPS